MNAYTFNISLSILNHLGRNLYRSLITVLGEAISNSWDADASNVYISIDKDNSRLTIVDDGIGMDSDSFQNKFLKIGYSKRLLQNKSAKKRPFIGRKGIGKLALLSCAERVIILSKNKASSLTGGVIDNTGLNKAITDDVSSNDYELGVPDKNLLSKYKNLQSGTVIIFEGIKEGIKNRIEYIRQLMALYFRFALLDPSFKIFLNDEKITLDDLSSIIEKTQFLWSFNENLKKDDFLEKLKISSSLKNKDAIHFENEEISGFIASVEKPSQLKIRGTEEKISVDLYVNGRMREKNILQHIPTARIVESYLYGQIHFNCLDDEVDRFTSSREGVVPDDPKYKQLLDLIKKEILPKIIEQWDDWRRENKQDGDSENTKVPPKQRKSEELYNAITDDYTHFDNKTSTEQKDKIDSWINELKDDAAFNYQSYGECFVAENLLRKYIEDKGDATNKKIEDEAQKWRKKENDNKIKANINIPIRSKTSDIYYASMENLAEVADKPGVTNTLIQDAREFKPIRDAMAHTSRLTDVAKHKLTSVFENIKYRLIDLLQHP